MMQKKLNKKNLQTLIDKILKDNNKFYGPVLESGSVCISEVNDADKIIFDYSNFKLPPKRLLRPWSQKICDIDNNEMNDVELPDERMIIFGIRPCDAVSLTYLDKVFLQGSYTDSFYKNKRDNATIITIVCNNIKDTCFCTSLNGGPMNSKGSDIMVFNLDDTLLFEASSSKGENLLKKYEQCFMDPTEEDSGKKQSQYIVTETVLTEIPVNEKLKENFNSPAWDKISQACLGCNVCTFLCPTCHCFTISDEIKEQKGRRIRVDDSCLQEGFTNEVSGHNPRPTGMERMRQRIMHKFSYALDLYEERFCVGCGRCIINCPVNIDIRETLIKVAK